jgi:hypothetical protein
MSQQLKLHMVFLNVAALARAYARCCCCFESFEALIFDMIFLIIMIRACRMKHHLWGYIDICFSCGGICSFRKWVCMHFELTSYIAWYETWYAICQPSSKSKLQYLYCKQADIRTNPYHKVIVSNRLKRIDLYDTEILSIEMVCIFFTKRNMCIKL